VQLKIAPLPRLPCRAAAAGLAHEKKIVKVNQAVRPLVLAALGLVAWSADATAAADAEAAQALMRQNNCTKCHAVDKDKDGPSFRRTARGLQNKPDAEQILVRHLTSGDIAVFPDGREEAHRIVKTNPPNDRAQVLNLVRWILEQK
jgi:cytochrome c